MVCPHATEDLGWGEGPQSLKGNQSGILGVSNLGPTLTLQTPLHPSGVSTAPKKKALMQCVAKKTKEVTMCQKDHAINATHDVPWRL